MAGNTLDDRLERRGVHHEGHERSRRAMQAYQNLKSLLTNAVDPKAVDEIYAGFVQYFGGLRVKTVLRSIRPGYSS